MTLATRARTSALAKPPLITRDTVLLETFACRATSAISGRRDIFGASLAAYFARFHIVPHGCGTGFRRGDSFSRPSCGRRCSERPRSGRDERFQAGQVGIFDRAFDDAAQLAFRVEKQVKRQVGVGFERGALQPFVALFALFEPVAASQAAHRLLRQEGAELALVVVERDEAELEAGRALDQLLLKADQPRDLFFAGFAPSRPKIDPGVAAAKRQRLGQRRLAGGHAL